MPFFLFHSYFILARVFVWEYYIHIVKWLTPLFSRKKDMGVETEYENGLSCLQCLPPCSQTQYLITTTRLQLRNLPAQTRNISRL